MVKNRFLLHGLFRRHCALCACMAAVSALGLALFVGAVSFHYSLSSALSGYVADYGYPDAVISVSSAYRTSAGDLSSLSGVEDVVTRVCTNTSLRKRDGTDLAVRAFSYSESDFSTLHFWSGSLTSGGVCLERRFAEDNGISVGDTVFVFLGTGYRSMYVSGIVSSPETLGMRRADDWISAPRVGALFFSDSVLQSTQLANLCNLFLLRLSPDADPDAALAAACDTLEAQGVLVKESYTFAASPVKRIMDSNLGPIHAMCVTVPAFFYLLVLCVLSLCVSTLVRLTRGEIGTLRALGFHKREVLSLFSSMMLVISALGTLLGLPLSFFVLSRCASFYRDFFLLPALPCRFDLASLLSGTVLLFALAQLAVLLGCRALSSISPSEAQRAASPRSVRPPLAVRTLLRRAGAAVKFSATTLLRSPSRFVFSLFCTAVTVTFIFSSLSFYTSNRYVLSQLFDERIHYDTLAYFTAAVDDAALDALYRVSGVTAAERSACYQRSITCADKVFDGTVIAAPAGTELLSIPDVGTVPEHGVVLERYAADRLGAVVGSTVTIDAVSFPVVGISLQTTSRVAYLSLSDAEMLSEADSHVLLCCADDADALETALRSIPGFLFSADVSDLAQKAEELFDSFNFIVRILLAFSVSLGLVITLITTGANLSERRRELCVLRTQGFTAAAISRSFLFQSLLLFFPALAIGLPLGAFTSRRILHRILTENRCYLYASGLPEYLCTAALLAAYLLLGHFLSMRRLYRWNLADSVKSSE